jgi:hypothetical protein
LSIFQISHAARRSIKDRTAEMMIAERMQDGVYLNKGVSTNKTISTTMAIMMFDIAVYTPALKLTADLENEPATTCPQLFSVQKVEV